MNELKLQSEMGGVSAPNAEVLKGYLHSIMFDGMHLEEWARKHPKVKCNVLTISLGCGCAKEFKRLIDIPNESIKCKHGTYFIVYDEKLGDKER